MKAQINHVSPLALPSIKLPHLFRSLSAILLIFCCFFLMGCAAPTTQQAPKATGNLKANESRICVYCYGWPPRLSAKLSDGDTFIGDLANRGYICWDRSPGQTEIRAVLPHAKGVLGGAKAALPLDLVAGQTYYVKAVWDANNWLVALSKASLVLRPNSEAIREIARECKNPQTGGE